MTSSRNTGGLLWLGLLVLALNCCFSTAFRNGDMRLQGGSEANEGRVEVYYQENWGTVCDDNWDLKDAEVVCRALGFENASKAVIGAKYGQGTGAILFDDVDCLGTEASLDQCKSRGWGKNDCNHAEDAGVVCIGKSKKMSTDSQTFELDRSSDFSEALNKLYNSKRYCDLNIVAVTPGNTSRPQTFCTHKLILSMNIEAAFLLKAETGTYTMTVEDECLPFVHLFIRYLYSKRIEIPFSSVKCIHKMASAYGVTELQQYCGQLFSLVLPADPTFKTQLDLYSYALSSEDSSLEELCLKYLAWNCEAFISSPTWLKLTPDQLRALLSQSDLVVPSELFLLEALQSWFSAQNCDNEITQKLIEEIRFPMMPPEHLFQLQFNMSLYKAFQSLFQTRILQALEFHTVSFGMLKQHKDLTKDTYLPRIYTAKTWSYHKSAGSSYGVYGHYNSYNPMSSFTTQKHSSFVFNTQMISWSAGVHDSYQSCLNYGYQCTRSNIPVLSLVMSSSADATIEYTNKAVFICKGSYISDVQDFKNHLSIVPTNDTGYFPCSGGYATYVFVIYPVYMRNNTL